MNDALLLLYLQMIVVLPLLTPLNFGSKSNKNPANHKNQLLMNFTILSKIIQILPKKAKK
jgi:hypothetical protein